MTDGIRFDLSPRTEFADRLEADLLRAIGDPAHTTSTPTRVTPRRDPNEEHIMTITLDPPVDQPAPHRRRGWTVALAAAATLLLVIAGIWAVTRNDNGPAGTHDVDFTVLWAYSELVSDCPTDVTNPICANRFDIPATAQFTGDLDGDAYQAVIWNDPIDYPDRSVDHLEHVATYSFAGSVAGCGVGRFMMVETVQFVSGTDRDRDTGTYIGRWQVVAESGRNGLQTITGEGTSTGLFGTAGDVGRSFTGTVTCDEPADTSALEIIAPLGSVVVPTSRGQVTPSGGDLPNGTYRAEFTAEDLDRLEPDVQHIFSDGGAIELTLRDGNYSAQRFLPSGAPEGLSFDSSYQVIGDTVIWLLPENVQFANSDGINVFEWSLDGDTLTFTQVDGKHRDPWFTVPYIRQP